MTVLLTPPSYSELADRLRDAEATVAMVRITIARASADGSKVVSIQALEEVLGDTTVEP